MRFINVTLQLRRQVALKLCGELNNLVFFDGACNFCTGSVQFILRHETDNVMRFTTLQSTTGCRLMREFGADPNDAETIVFDSEGNALTKSNAALALTRHLQGGWRMSQSIAKRRLSVPVGLSCSNAVICDSISWVILLILALAIVLFARKLWKAWKKTRDQ